MTGWRRQEGDTLIEVVISLAILAVVLSMAFNIGNLSYRIGVQARERTQASNLAQVQLERLTFYRDKLTQDNAAAPSVPILDAAHGFGCSGKWYMNDTAQPVCAGNGFDTSPFNGVSYNVSITGLPNASKTELAAKVTVEWTSLLASSISDAGKTNLNQANFNLELFDKRGIIPRNCDVAGAVSCQ